jgi:hypothetical protein
MSVGIFSWASLARLDKKKAVHAGVTIFTLCLLSLPLFSQSSQGTIQGTVLDQTGGAVAGATVTVTDVSRGIAHTLTTDSAGQYAANNLTPSTYTVRVEAGGFQAVEHTGVQVQVDQTVRVDLVVQPGQQNQTITVTSELPQIDTTDATLGGTVNNTQILALPLNGRNFERLLQLRPGVVTSVGNGAGTASTNGRRTGDDLFVIEGVSQIDPSNGSSIMNSVYRTGDASSLLPIDAIQEFNTEQDPKAEYGWRAGSVVNVGVKSGTNSLHGTAYAFGRDAQATDASNYFSTPGINPITPATLEQFGATAGGRIIKDKLFWFLGYEGLRTTLGDSAVDTIPTDAAGLGPATSMVDACNALKASGKTISPLNAQLAGLNTATCTVAPGSPSFENLFPYLPSATSNLFAPGLITTGPLNNGFFKGDYVVSERNHISGMYYVSKENQQVSYATGQLLPQWEANVPADVQMYDGAWTWTPNSTWVNDVRMGYAYLFNQTISADVDLLPFKPYPTGYGFNTGVTNPLYGGLPEIQIAGFTGYLGAGKRTGSRGPEGEVDFVDNVSYLRGKHAFKFGFEFMDEVYDNNSYDQANGDIKFASAKTATGLEEFLLGVPKNGTILLGNPNLVARERSFAGFFQDDWRLTTKLTLNLGLRYEVSLPPTEHDNYIGNFDPNVNPATTPALLQVGPGEPLTSLFNTDYKDISPRLGVAWDVRGNGKTVVRAGASVLNDMMLTSELLNPVPFGANFPDIGVNNSGTAINAHSPETVPLSAGQFTWSVAGPVFPGNTAYTIKGVTYTGITCTSPTTPGGPGPCQTNAVAPNFRTPFSAQYNLDIQQAITNNVTVDIAYVGNHGFDEASEADINQPAIGAGWDAAAVSTCLASAGSGYSSCNPNTAAEVGPYSAKFPYLSQIIQAGNLDWSNYNALQVTVSSRVSHGLTFLAGYTYSHALDMVSADSISQQAYPIDTYLPKLSYGDTNNDIRNRFTLSATYAVPGIKVPAQLLQGWSISSIVTLQGGLPWYPVDLTNDLTGTGEVNAGAAQTWNYAGPRSAFTSGPTGIPCFGPASGCTTAIPQSCVTAAEAPYAGNNTQQQLAVAALDNFGCYEQNGGILTPPAFGTIGNANRNIFRAPAYYNWDFSVAKEWKFKERFSAQFRVEFFNFLNRADFPIPGVVDPNAGSGGQFGCSCTTPDAAGGGQGTNSVLGSGGPRHVQFGLKLVY